MRRATITFAIACVAAVAAVAPAQAATITLGSSLADPSTFDTSQHCEAEGCTVSQLSLPGATTEAPQAGTITHWRALSSGAMRLVVLRATAGGSYQEVASSTSVTGDGLGVHEYTSSVPIQAGEFVGIAFADQSPTPAPGFRPASNAGMAVWPKRPNLLEPAVPNAIAAYELALQAELTVPDPSAPSPTPSGTTSSGGQTSGSTAVPAPLTTPALGAGSTLGQPPSILALSLTNRRLTLGSRKRKKARRGASSGTTALRYQLSAPADLAVDIQRQQCKKRKKKTRCSGFKTLTTLQQQASTETGQLNLSTRVGGTTLRPGRYQLSVTATNSAGRSDPRTVSFSVARAK